MTSGGRGRGDQAVLVGLDRCHDVAHAGVARALELLQQEVVDEGCGVCERPVERLVADARERWARACGSGVARVTPCGSAGVAV